MKLFFNTGQEALLVCFVLLFTICLCPREAHSDVNEALRCFMGHVIGS